MIPERYVWLTWSSAFLVPWIGFYLAYPRHRRIMLRVSLLTAPFGLTEPLFVPEYWDPPSLFGLARRTGFDLESLIFCFGIGGVGAVLVNVLTKRVVRPVPPSERLDSRHRLHRWIVASPFLVFAVLMPLGWNPIYPGILAMSVGAALTLWCRPDLTRSVALGAGVFVVYYAIFLVGLQLTAPGYVGRVWNLGALSGVRLGFVPLEELLFALGFGAYWTGVYEHLTWGRPLAVTGESRQAGGGTRGKKGERSSIAMSSVSLELGRSRGTAHSETRWEEAERPAIQHREDGVAHVRTVGRGDLRNRITSGRWADERVTD